MKHPRFIRLFVLAPALLAAASASAQTFETRAKQAYMIDAESGTVLYSKDPDKLAPPASLAKLMTIEVLFNELKQGRLTLDDTFAVSEYAWRKGGAAAGGSTMFAEVNSVVRIEDLIQGVVVQSGNDAAIVIAEGLGGTEENFAKMMTDRAREIGLEMSVFKNATGLPVEGQVVSARELAQLGLHIWREYPNYYRYYAQREFTWNGITQRNRNPLLDMGIGADGLKTGFTAEAGYGIVGAAEREGRRIFVALNGMTSERERADEARKMLDWGIRSFETNDLFEDGETIGEAKVFGGEKGGVALRAKGPVSILVPVTNRDRLIARIVYQGPVMAPVEAGTPVGTLKVWIGEALSQETPLFAAESVGVGSLWQRALDAVGELLVGWLR
jgi:D-alanyl-D-alanine carboxypeptidase (penicillin-binding protein 5/6)